jgi:hypothetical protein
MRREMRSSSHNRNHNRSSRVGEASGLNDGCEYFSINLELGRNNLKNYQSPLFPGAWL